MDIDKEEQLFQQQDKQDTVPEPKEEDHHEEESVAKEVVEEQDIVIENNVVEPEEASHNEVIQKETASHNAVIEEASQAKEAVQQAEEVSQKKANESGEQATNEVLREEQAQQKGPQILQGKDEEYQEKETEEVGSTEAIVEGIIVEFHVREGPKVSCRYPPNLHVDSKLPFLALADRSEASDSGFSYFMLRQAPHLVAGISCYRQRESSEESVRHKKQRALCVLVRKPYFAYVREVVERQVDQVVWESSEEAQAQALERLCQELSETLVNMENPRRINIHGVNSLVQSVHWLGGAKNVMVLVKCMLLGSTGVVVTGPSASMVSEIVLALCSLLPSFGGFLGQITGMEERDCDWTTATRQLVHLAMAASVEEPQKYNNNNTFRQRGVRAMQTSDPGWHSKMILMPYSSLMDLDELEAVYVPRKSTESAKVGLQGRWGFLAGAVNPLIASQVRRGLGDLVVDVEDKLDQDAAKNEVMKREAVVAAGGSGEDKQGNPMGKVDFSVPSSVHEQFQQFSKKAAKFMREKKEEMVQKIQQWALKPVTVTALTHAGRVAADLGSKDREFARKIDKMIQKRMESRSGASTPNRPGSPIPTEQQHSASKEQSKTKEEKGPPPPKSLSSFLTSLVSHVVDPSTLTKDKQKSTSASQLGRQRDGESEGHGEQEKDEGEHISSVSSAVEEPLFLSEEELDVKVRELFAAWMNHLFREVERYTNEVVLTHLKFKHKVFIGGHSKDYLMEWAERTSSSRERKTSSEIVQFRNGDEYRGELVLSDSEGFVDLLLSATSELDSERRLCRHGLGVYTCRRDGGWRYEGMWEDDMRHGSGILTLTHEPDKFLFDGDWENDQRSGHGTCTVSGKGHYSGGWKSDVFHGQGVLFDASGANYKGHWEAGKRQGGGCWVDSQGMSSYEGEWKADKPDGVGNAFFGEDGSKYCGLWKSGKQEGQGVWSRNSSEWYEGSWKRGVRDGKGTLVFMVEDDRRGVSIQVEMEGEWKEDAPVAHSEDFVLRELPSNTVLHIGKLDDYWNSGGYKLPAWAEKGQLPVFACDLGCGLQDFACPLKCVATRNGSIVSLQNAFPDRQDVESDTDVEDED